MAQSSEEQDLESTQKSNMRVHEKHTTRENLLHTLAPQLHCNLCFAVVSDFVWVLSCTYASHQKPPPILRKRFVMGNRIARADRNLWNVLRASINQTCRDALPAIPSDFCPLPFGSLLTNPELCLPQLVTAGIAAPSVDGLLRLPLA